MYDPHLTLFSHHLGRPFLFAFLALFVLVVERENPRNVEADVKVAFGDVAIGLANEHLLNNATRIGDVYLKNVSTGFNVHSKRERIAYLLPTYGRCDLSWNKPVVFGLNRHTSRNLYATASSQSEHIIPIGLCFHQIAVDEGGSKLKRESFRKLPSEHDLKRVVHTR